jgi:hypothetical protein
MVFKDFCVPSLYANLRTGIRDLKDLQSEKKILHVSVDGGRGVDFAMNTPAHVLIIKDIQSLSEFRQFAGRGARKHSQTCQVFICVPHDGFLANMRADNVQFHLTSHQAYLGDQDLTKMKICASLDGQLIRARNSQECETAVAILNDEECQVYADEGDPNKAKAAANYAKIQAGFPTVITCEANEFEKDDFFN